MNDLTLGKMGYYSELDWFRKTRMIRLAVTAPLLLALTGCASLSLPAFNPPSWQLPSMANLPYLPKWAALQPYTLDIQQGIIIDQDMIARLKPGQTRTQVGYVLGTPLLTDPFHANRWDYVYYTRIKNHLSEPNRLTVYFKDDKLEHFVSTYPQQVALEAHP